MQKDITEREDMIEVRHISKRYARNVTLAVQEVDLTFEENKIYAIVGESGSGKSTLAKMLGGILMPSEGEILYENKSIYPSCLKAGSTYFKHTQLILQNSKSALDPRLSIYNSLAEPLINFEKLSVKELNARIDGLLDRMELPKNILTRFPWELSGGQQKRICIARALAVSPQVIILDEAVSGLDMIVQKHILIRLLDLQRETRGTYIFVTHDMGVALFVADEIIVMKDGIVLEQEACNEGKPVFEDNYSKLLLSSAE